VLDRLSGKPVFGAEERPVPASVTAGEAAWPTQPFPLKPPALSRQFFTPEDVTDRTPEVREEALGRFKQLRSGSIVTPPSLRGTVVFPGLHGGANWSGASVDPETGILYVNTSDMPNILQLTQDTGGKWGLAGYQQFRDKDGYPGVKPPWGHLTAVDLNKGEFAWRVTLGDFPALRARGMAPTGTENFGGTIVTGGGLVFIGGTMDEKFRAFDKSTGKTLWETQLPAGGYATPCTYSYKGKQYVVIAAGGGGKLRTKSGGAYLAYALP
jgi:quinoprotein glucose dehydrogenase